MSLPPFSFSFFFDLLVNGLAMGLIYSLMAIGVTVVFGVMKMINFAHGELYMLGGYAVYYLTEYYVPPILAIPLSMAIVFCIAVAVERLTLSVTYTKRIERPGDYAILVTFGLMIFFQNFALMIFGPLYNRPESYFDLPLVIPGLGADRQIAALAAGILLAVVYVFITKTWMGRGLQAVAQNREAAQCIGISVGQMSGLAFGLSGALAAAAGAVLAPIFFVFPMSGSVPVLKAFVIVVLGGMGSIVGSFIGSITLGVLEMLGAGFISLDYRDAYSFLILFVVLLLRPEGLFGEKERRGG